MAELSLAALGPRGRHRALLVLNSFGLLAALRLLAKVQLARREGMRLIVLSLRVVLPLSTLVVFGNALAIIRSRRSLSMSRVLWNALSAWSFAEALFFVYILRSKRHLESQSTKRWGTILTHSTAEKRKASLQRYLLMIAQVSSGGSDASSGKEGTVKPKGRTVKKRSDMSSGSESDEPKRSNSGPMLQTLGERSSSMLKMAQYLSNSSSLNSPAKCRSREASVDDLLKLSERHSREGSTIRNQQSEALSEEEFQRLKILELVGWFYGRDKERDLENPASWLRRGNVEDWIAHYWFRGATPKEVATQPGGYGELNELVDVVLEFTGLNLPNGRNKKIRTRLLMADPLPVVHRPLLVYVGASLVCPYMTHHVMQLLGFRCHQVGGLSYWHRGRVSDISPDIDLAGPRQIPLVFIHGLGVGLVAYYLFIYRLSRRYSGELFVPDLPFLAMNPWETVPSAREVVAQLQDMLTSNRHQGAHFVGHSYGSMIVSWLVKMSPASVMYLTLMEPAGMLLLKSDNLTKAMYEAPTSAVAMFFRYFVFRELFTMNLLCRCTFWEQCALWPEEINVPSVVELAEHDFVVPSIFARRLLEHERSARKRKLKQSQGAPLRRKSTKLGFGSSQDVRKEGGRDVQANETTLLDIQWCEGFFHGQILGHRRQTLKLFSKMRQMVQNSQS